MQQSMHSGIGRLAFFHDATSQCAVIDAHEASDLGQGHHGSVQLSPNVGAFVVRLCDDIRPSAIAGFVRTIIVDTIQRVAIWPLSHVSKEVRERMPSFTECDTDGAIIPVGGMRRSLASGTDIHPCHIGRAQSSSMRMPMCGRARNRDITQQTTTTTHTAVSQVASITSRLIAADTLADPHRAWWLTFEVASSDDCQATKRETDHWKSQSAHVVSISQYGGKRVLHS